MPCYDERAAEDTRENINKVNTLTDMLCRVLNRLEIGKPFIVDLDIHEWYKHHKIQDKLREK